MMPSEHGGRQYETEHRSYVVDEEHRRLDRSSEEKVGKDTAGIIGGGSVFEVIAGAGAITLGILGLAGLLPFMFTAIAIIAIGAGLMFAGGSIAAKYEEVIHAGEPQGSSSGMAETGGGITAETVGGAAGVALGILALLGVEAFTLIPIALIVLGGAMAFGAGATQRLSRLVISASGAPKYKQRVANESVKGAATMQLIAGLGAVVLGILTLLGLGIGADAGTEATTGDMTLNLIAVIVLGGGLLLSGLAVGSKMINMLYRKRHESKGQEHYVAGEHHRPVYREYRHDPNQRPV
jgi:hypothetical protein